MTRRDFGSVRRLEKGRFQARYVDRNTACTSSRHWVARPRP